MKLYRYTKAQGKLVNKNLNIQPGRALEKVTSRNRYGHRVS